MPSSSPRHHRIPASYGLTLLSLMNERGHADDEVLRGSSLARAQLQDQHALIEGIQYAAVLANALRLEPDGSLPYELGLRSQVTKHGFVGFGLMSCATLRDALAFGARYFSARVPVFRSRMRMEAGQAVIELTESVPLGPLRGAIFDIVLVELCSLFARIRGSDTAAQGWRCEIDVAHAAPPAYAAYQRRLPRMHFERQGYRIRFPARLLDEAIPSADPVSVRLAIDRCEQELAAQDKARSVADKVAACLVCRNGAYPDVEAVAQRLLMSGRTLKRRLQDEGHSFQAVLDRVRLQDSLRLLALPRQSIKAVAEAVGYTDPANFTRAFTRWTGCTPKAWRAQQEQSDQGGHGLN